MSSGSKGWRARRGRAAGRPNWRRRNRVLSPVGELGARWAVFKRWERWGELLLLACGIGASSFVCGGNSPAALALRRVAKRLARRWRADTSALIRGGGVGFLGPASSVGYGLRPARDCVALLGAEGSGADCLATPLPRCLSDLSQTRPRPRGYAGGKPSAPALLTSSDVPRKPTPPPRASMFLVCGQGFEVRSRRRARTSGTAGRRSS
jgi:hypothetical protein